MLPALALAAVAEVQQEPAVLEGAGELALVALDVLQSGWLNQDESGVLADWR